MSKKDLVGKDVAVLAGSGAGVRVPRGTNLLFGETDEEHPPSWLEEQMMPFLPVVRVLRDVDAAIAASVKAEHGYRHAAIIHTQNVETATARMAQRP